MASVFGGLRVVELAQGMAGPLATGVMADHGAEVVKVEPPGGDWARVLPGFHVWNRGKRSVVLDLRATAGRAEARELAHSADVVVESLRPGRARELGLDGATLEHECPHLVHCSISGFGPATALRGFPADEGIVAAKSGRMLGTDALSGAVVADAAERPIHLAAPVASFGAAMLALEAISAALFDRARTGRGRRVATSLLEGAGAATMRLRFARDGDGLRPRDGDDLAYRGIVLTFLTVRCADGLHLQMCARQDHHFRNWMAAIGLADVLGEERYRGAPLGFRSGRDIDELRARIVDRMTTRTRAEWLATFVRADVGADPFLDPAEALAHPQMVLNDRVVVVDDPRLGPVTQVGPLVAMAETPAHIGAPAPTLGQHQDDERHRGPALLPVGGSPRPAEPGPRPLPLEGVTVVEVASFLAGPLGPTLLAELGARVVKVEPRAGDPFRRVGLEFAHLATGKESLALDLAHPEGRDVLARLVRQADVVVHNLRPGAAERLGLGYAALRRINPSLVYVQASAYGSRGPEAGRAAFHSTPHALSGGGVLQAGRGNPPVDDSYADPCAGLAVAAAVAMGLLARERWGCGQQVETTMLATAAYVHANDQVGYRGRPPPAVADAGQHGPCALRRLYRCRTGWLFLAADRPGGWEALVAALGAVDLAADRRFTTAADRGAHDPELAEELAHRLAPRSSHEWEAVLLAGGVPAAEADGPPFEEILVRHGLARPVEHEDVGPYWGLRPRVRVAGSEPRLGVPCGCGEHSDAVLAGLGYGEAERDALVAAGVVRRRSPRAAPPAVAGVAP
ncbi:MAG TPA: CoA transferase [Acidimicrobiales bacterium]|nr:CoA transferase [Acidimicrobiales bacterium]